MSGRIAGTLTLSRPAVTADVPVSESEPNGSVSLIETDPLALCRERFPEWFCPNPPAMPNEAPRLIAAGLGISPREAQALIEQWTTSLVYQQARRQRRQTVRMASRSRRENRSQDQGGAMTEGE